MPIDLERFGLGEQLRTAAQIGRVSQGLTTLEATARAVTRHLYDELTAGSRPQRACALVRCYKTHPFGALPLDLQRVARGMLPMTERLRPTVSCLTLLASAGDQPAWNSRQQSRGHQAIPLSSPDVIERAPMIAQLLRDFGLDPAQVVDPSPDVLRDRKGKNYGVFHVAEALGSPSIPAQEDFVKPFAIRSVVGFGGALPTGDLFAIILFSRVHIGAEVAERFRAVALQVKTALFRFGEHEVFDPAPPDRTAPVPRALTR